MIAPPCRAAASVVVRVAVGTLLAACVSLPGTDQRLDAQQQYNHDRVRKTTKVGPLEILHVQGNVHMIVGAGANVTVMAGTDGAVVVDTGTEAMTGALLAAIRFVTERPVRYVLNTNADADHMGGNKAISEAGENLAAINAGGNSGPRMSAAPIIAHENALNRLSAPTGEVSTYAFAFWPTSTFYGRKKSMSLNNEPYELLWQPAAHTDGDSIVFFRESDVVSAGDVYVTTGYPVIDAKRGGTIQGVLDGLNRLIDIAVPRFNQQGGTRVIPGHGRLSNESDVVEYRDMVTIVRDRIQLMIESTKTLDQVKAARPTLDYDGVYGATSGPWTTSMFVEAIYRDLSQLKGRPAL